MPILTSYSILRTQLYDLLHEMNKKNKAAKAVGQDEMEHTYDALMIPPGDGVSSGDESDREDQIGADVSDGSAPASPLVAATASPLQGATPSPCIAAPRRRRNHLLELTDAERALDEDTPPPSPCEDSDCQQPTPIARAAPEATPISNTRSVPAPSAAVDPKSTKKSRPPAEGGSLPRHRGKTEEAPKKEDSTGQGLLMFMHKSQEQSTKWMMEERTRADNIRAEDQRAAEARADLKEKIRQDQLNQAKLDREAAQAEAWLVREAEARREELREEARACDCTEDNCRYEASQERMATAQAAMMMALGRMAGGSGGNMASGFNFQPASDAP